MRKHLLFRFVDDRQRLAVPPAIRRHLGLKKDDWAEYVPHKDYVVFRKVNGGLKPTAPHATVDERGRIIIPAAVMKCLGLRRYDLVEFEPHPGHARLYRAIIRRAKKPT